VSESSHSDFVNGLLNGTGWKGVGSAFGTDATMRFGALSGVQPLRSNAIKPNDTKLQLGRIFMTFGFSIRFRN
jgi:hypothetical protein